MRVAVMAAPRDVRLTNANIPVPGAGEALIRIRAVGLCGSDLQYFAHGRIGDSHFTAGHVLGHEVAGVVEQLGPETRGPAPGRPVAVDPAIHCGHCRHCREGNPNFCKELRFFGSPPMPGALQEYLAHPAHLLIPLPTSMPLSVGAVVEPLGVAIHAVDLGHLRIGARVAVFGCGPIGLLTARVAQLSGAVQVFAAEPLAHRRRVAPLYGVTAAFDPNADDVVGEILARTDGEGVDVAFELAGSQAATEQAVAAVRPGGAVVLCGYWKEDGVTLPGIRIMRKGLTLRFVRRMKNTFERAIHLVDTGCVDLKGLISHEFPLADVAEAFARAEKRSPDILKAVITL